MHTNVPFSFILILVILPFQQPPRVQVNCPPACTVADLTHTIESCKNGKLLVSYHWNETTLNSRVGLSKNEKR